MIDLNNGRISKCKFINENGVSFVVYIAKTLRNFTLDDLVNGTKHLQIIKYPNGNYCLIPANEPVPLEPEDSMEQIEQCAREIQYNDAVAKADQERDWKNYPAQDYYMDNPDIFDGEVI